MCLRYVYTPTVSGVTHSSGFPCRSIMFSAFEIGATEVDSREAFDTASRKNLIAMFVCKQKGISPLVLNDVICRTTNMNGDEIIRSSHRLERAKLLTTTYC